MEAELREEIEVKARAVLAKQRSTQRRSIRYGQRFENRTGIAPIRSPHTSPAHWSFHPQFDPIHCIRHSKYIARNIWRKIDAGEYEPIPAVQFDIPKPGGGTRPIMSFSIPDSALANLLHRRLTKRNSRLFSGYSYAYRQDRNVFDAVLLLQRSLSNSKTYIIQYDFRAFFDSISQDYLRKIVSDKDSFIISEAERKVIFSFLSHRSASFDRYPHADFIHRDKGVPQGSSLSLFLANAAAHELDLALERQNGTFVRFADDVVAVTHSYADAARVAAQFRLHCRAAGLEINYEKSPGIKYFDIGPSLDPRSLFIDHDDAGNLETIDKFDFLGHSFSQHGTGLSEKSVKRIKRRISKIVYIHLLLYPRRGQFNPNRLSQTAYDWDLVTCLNEIRRYMYGGLFESEIFAFLTLGTKLRAVRGLMAFYPMVTDSRDLVALDGWLLNVVRRALRERRRLLQAAGYNVPLVSNAGLISGSWYNEPTIQNECKMPSFVMGWRAARKFYLRFGLNEIRAPSYYSITSMY
ncbi:MAG: reverse transcriptase domain-containing protein [Sphingopyxis sp.]